MAVPTIKVLLLAAGQSSRMGKPKQLLPVANETLISLALKKAMLASTNGVYCVLGANSDAIQSELRDYSITIVKNEQWQEGLGKSIAIGTTAILKKESETQGILILLADQPWVDDTYLEKMISRFKAQPDILVASDYGEFYGVPALFPESYFDQLEKLRGDNGAKELLNSEDIPVLGVRSPEKLNDIDTPEDYEQFLKTAHL